MNRQRLQRYEMLTQVVSFGNRNVSLFPRKTAAAGILKAVESDVNSISETTNSAISTETAMRTNLKRKVATRRALKTCLVQAGRMCREFDGPQFQLPKNINDQMLIALGRGFVADAKPVESEFAQHGLPIEDIDAAVQNLEQAVIDYSVAKTDHATATQKWDVAVADALRRLRRLDLLVANVLKDNPIATSEYEAARTILKPAGRKTAKTTAEPAAQPAAVPAAVPAVAPVPAATVAVSASAA